MGPTRKNARTGNHFIMMRHMTRKTSSEASWRSTGLGSFLCFTPEAADSPDISAPTTPESPGFALPYLSTSPRTAPLMDSSYDEVSDTSPNYSQPTYIPPDNSTVISYSVPPMPTVTRRRPTTDSEATCPQFYIMLSGSFSASKTIFCRRMFSNTHHPCEPLSPAIQEMMEESIHTQIVDLMDRKYRDSLQLSAQTGQAVDEEYRISFAMGDLQGMGDTKSYTGSQTLLLCAEEAREITTSLETIVARQIAIFDPPAELDGCRVVDILDSKPLNLTLRVDICDCSQKVLVTRLVACRTPTYPLPPADEVRALMQRIWKNTYEVVGREERSRRDSACFSVEQKESMAPYRFCVSFDVLFGDAEHKWFGGLCYGSRPAEFSEFTLERLTRKVVVIFKEQLAIFEVLGNLGWPEREDGKEGGFITTDGLEEGKESVGSKGNVKNVKQEKSMWWRLSGSSGRRSGEKSL